MDDRAHGITTNSGNIKNSKHCSHYALIIERKATINIKYRQDLSIRMKVYKTTKKMQHYDLIGDKLVISQTAKCWWEAGRQRLQCEYETNEEKKAQQCTSNTIRESATKRSIARNNEYRTIVKTTNVGYCHSNVITIG